MSIRTMLYLSAFILTLSGPFTEAHAGNTATGIVLHEEAGRTRCILSLENRPVFTVKDTGGSEVLLLLMETGESDSFREDAARYPSSFKPDSAHTEGALALRFTLPGPLAELITAWMPAEQALYLHFVHQGKGLEQRDGRPGEPTLRAVRFGFGDMSTRMAVTLGEHAAWELTQQAEDHARISFSSIRTELEEREFGPSGNLALAGFERKGDAADINVNLVSRIAGIHVFWTDDGRHLVTDFFEGPLLALYEEPDPRTLVRIPQETPSDFSDIPLHNGTDSDKPFVRGRIIRDEDDPASLSPEQLEGPGNGKHKELAEPDFPMGAEPAQAVLYGLIRGAIEENDYKAAAELCREFLDKFPGSPMVEQVAFIKGDAEFGRLEQGDKGRFAPMMEAYQSAISRFSNSPIAPKAHLNMARAAAMFGNHFAATGYLNLALNSTNNPDVLADALVERGRINLEINRPDSAVMDFKAVMDHYPESSQALKARMGLAMYYQSLGLHDEAFDILEQLAHEQPLLHLSHPRFLLLRGTNYLHMKQYDKARDFYFHALNIGGQPEGADLLLARIGDTHHHASKPGEAEVFYRMVIIDYPGSEGAAIAKLRLAGYEFGYGVFKELLDEHPDQAVADLAAVEMAKKMYGEGEFTRAMDVLSGHIGSPFPSEIRKEARGVYYRAAEEEMKRLHSSGEMHLLVDFYRSRRTELQRNINPEVILLAGLSLNRLGHHSEAVTLLQEIENYDLSPISRGERILALAESLFCTGAEAGAAALLEKKEGVELLAPTDRQRLDHMLAGFYMEVGRNKDAYRLFEKLVSGERLLPDREIATIYLQMGRIASGEGDFEGARTSLYHCIEIVEKSDQDKDILRQAYSELGTSNYLDGRYANALEAFNRAIENGFSAEVKGYYEVLFKMAQAYLETGDFSLAQPILVELSEEADELQQQRARIRLGRLGLERQLQRISLGSHGNH